MDVLRNLIRRYLGALVVGILGAGLVFLGFHLWTDHENLHALVQIEAARQAAQRAPAPAPVPPSAPK